MSCCVLFAQPASDVLALHILIKTKKSLAVMKRIYILLISLLMMQLCVAAVVSTTPGGLSAKISNPSSVRELTIAGSIDARDFLFINNKLTNLEILDLSSVSITAWSDDVNPVFTEASSYDANSIPPTAFAGTKLHSIAFPRSLKRIGYGAFAGCHELEGISLPNGLTTIDAQAFNGCSSLSTVRLPASVTSVGRSAFAYCQSLMNVVLIPDEAMTLGDEAFMGCPVLNRVVMGQNVEVVGARAFAGCTSLKSLNVERNSSLRKIGDGAFMNSALTTFDFTNAELVDSIGEWAFSGTSLQEVKLPQHLRHLEAGAFAATPALKTIVLPKQLTYMTPYLLAESAATNIYINTSNVGSIEDYALYNTAASSIELPGRIHYIGSQAMAGATSATVLKSMPLSVPELGDEVWAGVKQQSVQLQVNHSVAADYGSAAQWQEFTIADLTLLGDVNSDGSVDLVDADDLQGFLVDGRTDKVDLDKVDVNGDSFNDIADLVAVQNLLLDRSVIRPTKRSNEQHENFEAADFEIEDYDSHKLEVKLHNVRDYTALQFTLTVPEELLLKEVRIGDRAPGHQLYSTMKSEGKWEVVVFSSFNEEIDNIDAPLLTATVEARGRWECDMKLDILFSDIVMAAADENTYKLDDMDVIVTASTRILDIRSEVDEVKNDPEAPVDVYNTRGQLLKKQVKQEQATQGLEPGIYIVGHKKMVVR